MSAMLVGGWIIVGCLTGWKKMS